MTLFFINYFEVFKTVMNSRVVGIQKIRFTFGSQVAYNLSKQKVKRNIYVIFSVLPSTKEILKE